MKSRRLGSFVYAAYQICGVSMIHWPQRMRNGMHSCQPEQVIRVRGSRIARGLSYL